MPALSRLRLRQLQGNRLDGDTRIWNGPSIGAECVRARRRSLYGMGIRHGPGSDRNAALRHSRHSDSLRLGRAIPLPDLEMNASYEWLRAFVPFDMSPTELRDLLTSRCATVDDLVSFREDLRDVVIGRVVEVKKHPNSDHLWLTKVDAGGGTLLDVVCGAANVSADTLYPFAPVGAVLPGGLKIEKKKIRGETSEGMLCSAKELGLGQDHEGIMALTVTAEPGSKFLQAMPIGDTCLVIDVLPNRPDLLSHEGLAREIAAATGGSVTRPEITDEKGVVIRTHTVKATSGKDGDDTVKLEDTDGCMRNAGADTTGWKAG